MITSLENYRQRLLSVAANGSSATAVETFPRIAPDDSRFQDLKDACFLLSEGFLELDDLIETYVRRVPLTSRDTGTTDADRFLMWIEDQIHLSDEQRDLIVCLQSRHAVEFVALKKRLAQIRFQEMLAGETFCPDSARHLSQNVYLNPAHVWATFESRILLDDETPVPATVLFFAGENEIRTVVVNPEGERLLRGLAQGPQRLRVLLRQTARDEREQFLRAIRDMIELELIALG